MRFDRFRLFVCLQLVHGIVYTTLVAYSVQMTLLNYIVVMWNPGRLQEDTVP